MTCGGTCWRGAVPFYEEFVKQQANNPELRWQLGQAHFQLAFLRRRWVNLRWRRRPLRQAREIHERIVDDNPGIAAYQAGLAQCHNNLGLLHWNQGRAEPAADELLAAWKLYGTLSAASSTSAYSAWRWSAVNTTMGSRYAMQASSPKRSSNFAVRRQTQQAMVEKAPNEPGCRRLLALIHRDLGHLLNMQGKYGNAESMQLALTHCEELVKEPAIRQRHGTIWRPRSLNGVTFCRNRAHGRVRGSGPRSPTSPRRWPTSFHESTNMSKDGRRTEVGSAACCKSLTKMRKRKPNLRHESPAAAASDKYCRFTRGILTLNGVRCNLAKLLIRRKAYAEAN